ncbi:hypothetical protein [Candidatus Vidania fulgoroideorum]
MKKKNKFMVVIMYKNKQYIIDKKIFSFKGEKIKKKYIKIKKVLLLKTEKKIYLGKPYIKNIKIIIYACLIKKKKKHIIKFKRRKRYKILKNLTYYKYLGIIRKIKWQKKKQ